MKEISKTVMKIVGLGIMGIIIALAIFYGALFLFILYLETEPAYLIGG
jgi:hypothetical protein